MPVRLNLIIFSKSGFFTCFLTCWIILAPQLLKAQHSDAELWKGIALEREFFDKLKFELEDQVRLRNNLSTFKSNLVNIEVQYKIKKFLRVASGYRFTLSPSVNEHRIYGDLVFKRDFEKVNLELTLRARSQHDFEKASAAVNVFRPKITLAYSKKKLDIEPFIATEAFYEYSVFEKEWNAYRFYIGLNYELAKKNKLKLAYVFAKEFNEPNPLTKHIIQLGFSLDLTEKKKVKK